MRQQNRTRHPAARILSKHRVWSLTAIALTVVLLINGQSPVTATPPAASRHEIRGVWLTNIDSQVLFDRDRLQESVQDLARHNFNTLYPTVWNWGYTLYPSQVAKQATGEAMDPRPEAAGLQGRNMLTEIVTEGHKHQMAVIPWFEFGCMAPADSELATRHPDWLTTRQDGNSVWMEGTDPRVWLNPFKPEVQQFIQNLILEIVSQYDVDGIQLDDHFGLPAEFGYDSFTLQLYQQENPSKPVPTNPQDPDWVRWRANKITGFVGQLFRAIKTRKPNVLFALSPNPYPFAYNAHLQDWLAWERQGLIEELLVQVYRNDLKEFTNELAHPSIQDARSHIPTGVGILTGLKGNPVSVAQIQTQVQAVRSQQLSGVSFFFYETLWNLATEPERDRKIAFQALFTPSAARPNIIQGWTPSN